MLVRLRGAIGAVVLTTAMALGWTCAGPAGADTAGTVHFVRSADSSFDGYSSTSSPSTQAWIRTHMWRMMVWSPFFDEKTSWYTQGWLYDDAYAIYHESQLAGEHPEWILKDGSGNKLYIPYACSNGSCTQYAGDISNPAYRQYWIAGAKASFAHGYRGLFIDDANMEERVGDGQGNFVAPIDSATHQPMTSTAWRAYMAQFMAEIRGALPTAEIVDNAIWFANSDAGTSDPSIRRQVESANYILLERGVNDSGLTGGNGQWSLNAFFSYVDQIHALGRGVVLDGSAGDPQGMEYSLASYLLISTGNDAVSGDKQTPEHWWGGWDVNLGEATGARHAWGNLLRRDFTGGVALVNPPGGSTQTVSLPTPMRDVNGNSVTSVTIPAASGAVLRSNAPPPAAGSGEPAAPVPTQTIVEPVAPARHQLPSGKIPGASPTRAPGAPAPPLGSKSTLHRHRHTHHQRRHTHHRRRHARQARGRSAHRWRHRVVLSRIGGTVLRATRGAVAIQVEARRAHHWVLVRRTLASVDRAGHFARSLHLRAAERYRVLAIYKGASGYRPSRSSYRVVMLRAR